MAATKANFGQFREGCKEEWKQNLERNPMCVRCRCISFFTTLWNLHTCKSFFYLNWNFRFKCICVFSRGTIIGIPANQVPVALKIMQWLLCADNSNFGKWKVNNSHFKIAFFIVAGMHSTLLQNFEKPSLKRSHLIKHNMFLSRK